MVQVVNFWSSAHRETFTPIPGSLSASVSDNSVIAGTGASLVAIKRACSVTAAALRSCQSRGQTDWSSFDRHRKPDGEPYLM
jgi:hypothetical protein